MANLGDGNVPDDALSGNNAQTTIDPPGSFEAGENNMPSITSQERLVEDIRDLKNKLAELETRQAKTLGEGSAVSGTARETVDPQVMAEIEQYQRMEACLYKHRKDWENKSSEKPWGAFFSQGRRMYNDNQNWPLQPRSMFIYHNDPYERPDIFDPTHDCGTDSEHGRIKAGDSSRDNYDKVIDWGNRRDRLRTTFEWQMDLLFLNEELEKKKETQMKVAEDKRRRERRMAGAIVKADGSQNENTSSSALSLFAAPSLNWVEWYDFDQLSTIEEKEANAIDILVGDPLIDEELSGNQFWYGVSGRRLNQDVSKSTGRQPFDPIEPGKSPMPERIRVHSEALLRILSSVLGTHGRSLLELEEMRAVFIRPYKVLSYREQALRGWYTALQKKLRKKSAMQQVRTEPETDKVGVSSDAESETNAPQDQNEEIMNNNLETQERFPDGETESSTSVGALFDHEQESESEEEEGKEKSDKNDITKSATALAHLKCLLEFVDSSIVAKRNYLRSSQCRKVFFSDLWQLFHPGMEVIERDGKQAYKVIDVNSARHRIARPWERWYTENRQNQLPKPADFSVRCVYIDFDGKNVGPVVKVFDFKRFDGEKDVTSLAIYPLHLHPIKKADYSVAEWQTLVDVPGEEKYRQKLMQRGAKFLEVAEVKHMYYAGPTLEAKDEVESPVVIDFETAFIMRNDKPDPPPQDFGNPMAAEAARLEFEKKRWKPKLSTLVGTADTNESTLPALDDAPCSGACCRGEYVHDDQYVDKSQAADYINSLLPKVGSLDEQPPITIMPRPLKELKTGPGGSIQCPDDELVIMSYRVFGFVLRSRKWGMFHNHPVTLLLTIMLTK